MQIVRNFWYLVFLSVLVREILIIIDLRRGVILIFLPGVKILIRILFFLIPLWEFLPTHLITSADCAAETERDRLRENKIFFRA